MNKVILPFPFSSAGTLKIKGRRNSTFLSAFWIAGEGAGFLFLRNIFYPFDLHFLFSISKCARAHNIQKICTRNSWRSRHYIKKPDDSGK